MTGLRVRYRRRRECHGTYSCCQYCDQPMCNSWNDPHLIARLRYRLNAWRAS